MNGCLDSGHPAVQIGPAGGRGRSQRSTPASGGGMTVYSKVYTISLRMQLGSPHTRGGKMAPAIVGCPCLEGALTELASTT
jgi:hypothetical protein